MRSPLIRLAVIATAAIGLSACVAYPAGYRDYGYYRGGYHRHYGPPPGYAYRDYGYGYGRGYYYR